METIYNFDGLLKNDVLQYNIDTGKFIKIPWDLDLTFGLMDTVEKSAEILVKVLSMGGKRQTISSDNFRDLARDFNVTISEEYLK